MASGTTEQARVRRGKKRPAHDQMTASSSSLDVPRTMSRSSKDTGYVDNWQTGKTVTECNLHMLTTEDCSDVIFRVGVDKHVVRAHRYVLVSRSCVFHAMFCGPLAEKGEVTIPDIEPVVFREFLRYLYTDTATLTADTVTGLLYTSRKYAVDSLQEMCVTFLEKSLSEENACQILEHCHYYREADLEEKAIKILTEARMKVIKSPGFLELCHNCFGKFLESEQLNIKEEEIFEAALTWTKAKCKDEGVDTNPENLKKHLGDMRYQIRFTEFPLEYLVTVVGPSGILTNDERIRIMDRSVTSNVDIAPFKHGPRQRKQEKKGDIEPLQTLTHYICRFKTLAYHGISCKGKPQAISFTVNKKISLVGCQLYGPYYQSESTHSLDVLLYDDQDQVIAQHVSITDWKLRGQNELSDVMFPDPVPIVAGRTYTICVTMTGDDTCCGWHGQSSVIVDGVTFTFSNSKYSKYTTVNEGQIPGLIWR